jgi:hypothetical protein
MIWVYLILNSIASFICIKGIYNLIGEPRRLLPSFRICKGGMTRTNIFFFFFAFLPLC